MAEQNQENQQGEQAQNQQQSGDAGAGAAGDDKSKDKNVDTAKIEADKKAAAEAEEARIEVEVAKRAEKLAEKKARTMLEAKEQEAAKAAERAKMDVADKAKADKADSDAKAAELSAKLAASELRNELQSQMLVKGLRPATAQSMKYIADAVAAEQAAGTTDVAAALAKVQKSEGNLFAMPANNQNQNGNAQPGNLNQQSRANTGGAAGGGTERPVTGAAADQPQYRTKAPLELIADPKNINPRELADSIFERHKVRPNFLMAN